MRFSDEQEKSGKNKYDNVHMDALVRWHNDRKSSSSSVQMRRHIESMFEKSAGYGHMLYNDDQSIRAANWATIVHNVVIAFNDGDNACLEEQCGTAAVIDGDNSVALLFMATYSSVLHAQQVLHLLLVHFTKEKQWREK